MRKLSLIVLLLLAGCRDLSGDGGLSTGPEPVERPASPADGLGDYSTFWSHLSREEQQGALKTIDQVYTERGLSHVRGQIAIVQGDLPDGAMAVIIRSSQTPERPILVLSENNANEKAMLAGISAFAQGIDDSPTPADARVVWRTMTEALPEARAVQQLDGVGASRSLPSGSPLIDRLLSTASSVGRIDLPGIGSATIFSF